MRQLNTFAAMLPKTRTLLIAGFGALLLLMGFTGVLVWRSVHNIAAENEEVRVEFMKTNALLNAIRSDIYTSGTYIRDFLLDTDTKQATQNREYLERARKDIDVSVKSFLAAGPSPEAEALRAFNRELQIYWNTIDPVFQWGVEKRSAQGYRFLRDQVFPRRTAILALANGIATISEHQLTERDARIGRLFSGFRTEVLTTIAITFGVGLLVTLLSLSKLLALERNTASRYEEALRARDEIKALSTRLVETQERERRKVARELHDEVGQTLSALLIELSNLSALTDPSDEPITRKIETIRQLGQNSVGVVRDMSMLLRPSMLDDMGVIAAVRWQMRECANRTGIQVTLEEHDWSDTLPEVYNTCIYRLTQESLNNVTKHSGAKCCQLVISRTSKMLEFSVRDNGRGFDFDQGMGLGILGMRERVSDLKGEFRVDSKVGSGTFIQVTLPLPGEPEGQIS